MKFLLALALFGLLHEGSASSETANKASRPIAVVAKGLGAAPGAIVCPDMDTVVLMFHWYSDHWSDAMQDALTQGQSKLVRGAPTSSPPLSRYGCSLIKPGTPMMLERGNIVPVVSAKLSSGKAIRGVTLGDMYVKTPEELAKEQAEFKAMLQKQAALEPQRSNEADVVAKKLGPVPGTIICADTNTVTLLYQDYLELAQRGNAGPPDDLAKFGCVLIPAGTGMRMHLRGTEIWVIAPQPGHDDVQGATMSAMVAGR